VHQKGGGLSDGYSKKMCVTVGLLVYLTVEPPQRSQLLDGCESSIKIEKNEMGGVCSAYGGGERIGVYRVLVRKPGGKRSLGRLRCRWDDNIKMDLQEVGCGSVDWIELAQDRDRWRTLVNAVMNLRVT